MNLEFEGSYTQDQLLAAEHAVARAYMQDPPWTRRVLIPAGVLTTVAASWFALTNWTGPHSLQFPLLFALPTAIAIWRGRRAAAARAPLVGQLMSGAFSNDGLRWAGPDGESFVSWDQVLAAADTSDGLLVVFSQNQVMFVPDTFLKSLHYKKEIVGLFRKHVKAKTVVPSVDWPRIGRGFLGALVLLALVFYFAR